MIPDVIDYETIVLTIVKLGYKLHSGFGFIHPEQKSWIFDLFAGQRVFVTDLLDPIQAPGRHRVIEQFNNLTLACLNPDDLIISKMFRGDRVDVDDSIVIIRSERLDLVALAERYKDTAGYHYNPVSCKRNLKYLIDDMKKSDIDPTPLEEMYESWTP